AHGEGPGGAFTVHGLGRSGGAVRGREPGSAVGSADPSLPRVVGDRGTGPLGRDLRLRPEVPGLGWRGVSGTEAAGRPRRRAGGAFAGSGPPGGRGDRGEGHRPHRLPGTGWGGLGKRDQHHPRFDGRLSVDRSASLPGGVVRRPGGRGSRRSGTRLLYRRFRRRRSPQRGRDRIEVGLTDFGQRFTTGQVRVRVMPSMAWIRATTSFPRASTSSAVAFTITS